ncbi:MAG: hypothetical protein CMP07_09960 [Xanthomonadales bacterium]|nr:hypothetical protein [Xanthomonadales bacterium]
MNLPNAFRKNCHRFSLHQAYKTTRTLVPVLLALVASGLQAAIPASERQVLMDIYNATDGPNWVDNTGWGGAAGTECKWFGVTCNGSETNVLRIDLDLNGLAGGPLPSLVGLAELEVFDVDANGVTGPVPALPANLIRFVAGRNPITGTIPDLQAVPGLTQFIVNSAQLTGPLPDRSGMSNLSILNVSGNELTGPLPELSGLQSLSAFIVSDNQLEGTIPALTDMPRLETFFVRNNGLSGSLPDLSDVPGLRFFAAGGGPLTGNIPDLSGLSDLVLFEVRDSQVSGEIPSLAGLSSLVTFDVSNNRLTGELPELSDAPTLFLFAAEGNALVGSIPSLTGMSQLESIRLADNALDGPVPPIGDVNLEPGESSLCGNQLVTSEDPALDEAWETATGGDWIACQDIFRPIPVDSTWALLLLITLMASVGLPFASSLRRQ